MDLHIASATLSFHHFSGKVVREFKKQIAFQPRIKQHISELKMVLVTHTKASAIGFDTAEEFVETSTT